MNITLHNPPNFILIHKKSNKKIYVRDCDFISYDENKFIKEQEQTKLF